MAEFTSGAPTLATDSTWNAAGDIVYASADDTATVLSIGSTNAVLQVTCGLPAWNTCVTLAGNLTVQGTTTTIESTVTTIVDPLVIYSQGTTGTPTKDSGFVVERGCSANVAFLWDESADEFAVVGCTSETGTTAGNVTITAYGKLHSLCMNVGGDLTVGGGCITLSAATDIDLIDNTASALSFDSTGKTGIIDIVTTDCSEGVTMSGTLGVTGVLTATGGIELSHACQNTLTASGGVLSIQGNRIFHACGTDIPVADGGTGASTFTANGILVGNGTSAIGVTATMATKGHLMIGDGSGVPSMLGVGSNNQVLTACSSEGTGVKWAAAAGGGSMTLITSQNITSSTATIDFECLSGYCTYFLSIAGAVPVADGPYAVMQLGCDTCSYSTAEQSYGWSHYGIHAHPSSSPIHTAFLGTTCSNETTYIVLYRRGVGSDTGEGFSANLWIHARASQKVRINGTFSASSYLNEASGGIVVGEHRALFTAGDFDRVRFKFHCNNVESGRFSMYGVSHA